MIRIVLAAFMLGIFCQVSYGQRKETFDIVTYQVPTGWNKESADFGVSFTKINNTTGSWCRLSIYKSMVSSGDPMTDFTNEWNALILKDHPDAAMPQPETETEDGWTSKSGPAKFKFNNEDAYASLSTISGYGTEISIVVLMNSEEFMTEVTKLLGSLDLKKPTVQLSNNTTDNTKMSTTSPVNTQPVSGTSAKNGISLFTTNFDDGWVAQAFADYVRVTKNQFTVLLHFGVGMTDEMRNNNNMEAALFDRLILPRYNVSNIRKFQDSERCYSCIYFFEAEGVEKATGKRCHIGFRVITNNGISRCIEIISPSASAFAQEFPKQEKIQAMLNYNKFAVTANDLIGTWEESTFSGVDMYSTVTGEYAGMNSTSSAAKFIIKPTEYESTHNGVFDRISYTKIYSQKYNGKYTVTNWDITLTNRFEGKEEIFWAQFEAVRAGRILHLVRKSATGITFDLVKTD